MTKAFARYPKRARSFVRGELEAGIGHRIAELGHVQERRRLQDHPCEHGDAVLITRGADSKTLFNSGRIIAAQDGVGAWRGTQSEQVRINPTFNMQPVPIFSAVVTTEDKLNDVLRGRRPLSVVTRIVEDWRNSGGDEGRAFFEKALAANVR